tara:strand:+ start:10669 stop:10983 length:315 start_codon:yes stop_codon:yes gene_type:complete
LPTKLGSYLSDKKIAYEIASSKYLAKDNEKTRANAAVSYASWLRGSPLYKTGRLLPRIKCADDYLGREELLILEKGLFLISLNRSKGQMGTKGPLNLGLPTSIE